ncbi:helix-turn-helix domain-containing protein [Streptomyces nogalater]
MAAAHSESRRIGEVIRRARVLQGRSQKDVAASLGYHQSKVSRLESGRGTDNMGVLRAVAAELGIPAREVGLAVAREASTADPGTGEMQRRTFIAASMAVSTAALTASPTLSAVNLPPATPRTRASASCGRCCREPARRAPVPGWTRTAFVCASAQRAGSSTSVTTRGWSKCCRV